MGKRGLPKKALVGLLAGALVVAMVAAGVIMKVTHDHHVAATRLAAKHKADAAARAQAAANEREAKIAGQKAADAAERRDRRSLVRQMQASITKDARKDVKDGILDGPILFTSCDPLGGGSTDDLTALTTTYECLAVQKKHSNGMNSGWAFSATANWTESSYTWHLGR